MAESNTINDYKALTSTLAKASLQVYWKKEIKIQEVVPSFPKEKRGPAIFMTLTGEAREPILTMEIEELTAKNAAQNLKEKPDNVYLMDENFDKFMWSSDMSVSDYLIKFQQLNFKAKSLQMEILDDGVLAYGLLNSANLTNEQKQPVNTTVHKMDHQVMKDTN